MKVKVKHHLRDGRTIEIEGEPHDVAHTVHELDKKPPEDHDYHKAEQIELVGLRPTDRPSESAPQTVRVRKRLVADYILSLDQPEIKHSIKDLMIHFVGRILPSDDPKSGYTNFYNMVIRAQELIAKEKGGGRWEADWALDRDGRYRVYRFVQDLQK